MNSITRARRALGVVALTVVAGGALAAEALGHARIFPSKVEAGIGHAYALVVPNETDDATITEIELTVPKGVLLGGFAAAPGWEREVETGEGGGGGHGGGGAVTKVTWTGGDTPAGEAAWFHFTGRPDEEGESVSEYEFGVRQTYSDGTVADWSGPQDSDEPAPVVQLTSAGDTATSSPGATGAIEPAAAVEASDDEDDDGGSTGTIALIVAGLALLLALGGLVRGGGRSLT